MTTLTTTPDGRWLLTVDGIRRGTYDDIYVACRAAAEWRAA